MRAVLALSASLLVVPLASTASAQNAGAMFDMFTNMMRAAIVEHARTEWSKIPRDQAACLEQQGYQIGGFIQNGIDPNDPRLSGVRAACTPQRVLARAAPQEPQRSPPPKLQNAQDKKSPFFVDGIALGDRADVDSDTYKQYECEQSEQYPGFTRCSWQRSNDDSDSMMHAPDGVVVYVNRFIEPATFKPNEATEEVKRLSQKFSQQPKIFRMPRRPDGTEGLIAVWGALVLEPLDSASMATLAAGHGAQKGYLVDFIGHFSQSARLGLPVYSVSGGAGYVWAASYDKRGRGSLRFFAMDPSALISRYASSDKNDSGNTPPPGPPEPAPLKDTQRLKEARLFLDDAKKFIRDQTAVPSIPAIAQEAAKLQIAVDKFDELAAIQSEKRLGDLLTNIPGFEQNRKQQKDNRNLEEARKLAQARSEAATFINTIEGYLKAQLGDPKTQAMIQLRDRLDGALKRGALDEIGSANDAASDYLRGYGIKPEDGGSVLPQGPPADIVLLYNAASTAPSVWRGLNGNLAFQNDRASVCFAQVQPDAVMVRYVEGIIRQQGVKSVVTERTPCDLARSAVVNDFIVFQRSGLSKQPGGYTRILEDLRNGGTFREYRTVTDFPSILREREELSRRIESDVENGARPGYGVVVVRESAAACVVAPNASDQLDGLQELLTRNRDIIAPQLDADWKFIAESTANLTFRDLQRQQCGYVTGKASDLRSLTLALETERVAHSFSPLWWGEDDLHQAVLDLRGRQPKTLLGNNFDPKVNNDLQDKQDKLRKENGGPARALMNSIQDFVKSVAENQRSDDRRFVNFSDWLAKRFAGQWEATEVRSDIADFGVAQWNKRPLNAIIVKTEIKQSNRNLGKYDSRCFLFGLVDDPEFTMQRGLFSTECSDSATIVRDWKTGLGFETEWNLVDKQAL
jgi:hypothetical protein